MKISTCADLEARFREIRNYRRRFGVSDVVGFVSGSALPAICGIMGLRRTGKTTIMWHAMIDLLERSGKSSLYIEMQPGDDMIDLENFLDRHAGEGCVNFFIDEITCLPDFSAKGASLSDSYAARGLKIVISGTDSLLLGIAGKNSLFNRIVPVRTTWMPWREYAHVTGAERKEADIHSFDDYLENGGILYNSESEKMDASDYIRTSIVDNLINSLDRDHDGRNYDELSHLRYRGNLKDFILRVLDDNTHRFIADLLKRQASMSEFAAAKGIVRKRSPNIPSESLDDAFRLIADRMGYIEHELDDPVPNDGELDAVCGWLEMMDVLVPDQSRPTSVADPAGSFAPLIGARNAHGGSIHEFLLTQPALRWHQCLNVFDVIFRDSRFLSALGSDSIAARRLLTSALKGELLEDVVLIDAKKTLKDSCDVFSWKFSPQRHSRQGEFDMAIAALDKERIPDACDIFEIKKSGHACWEQARHLRHPEFLDWFSVHVCPLRFRAVLYRGSEFMDFDDVMWLNVEDFLMHLPDCRKRISKKFDELQASRARHDRRVAEWIDECMGMDGLLDHAAEYFQRPCAEAEIPFADWLREKDADMPDHLENECHAMESANPFGVAQGWSGFQKMIMDFDRDKKEMSSGERILALKAMLDRKEKRDAPKG